MDTLSYRKEDTLYKRAIDLKRKLSKVQLFAETKTSQEIFFSYLMYTFSYH